jgi:hypothetical protein
MLIARVRRSSVLLVARLNKALRAVVFSKPHSNAKCFGTNWQHMQWRCLVERNELQKKLQQMSAIQPVTMPKPTKVINTCMWLWFVGGVGCTRCCAMSAALAPSSCNQLFVRCAYQPNERAHASSPCLHIKKTPLKPKKNWLCSRARGVGVVQLGL